MPGVKKKEKNGKWKYIISIITNAVLLYILNNLLFWGIPFLTDSFSGILWAINLALGATIFSRLLLIIYDAAWFRHLCMMILNIMYIFAIYLLIVTFPFTFSGESWALWVKIGLTLVIAASGISFFVEFFKATHHIN